MTQSGPVLAFQREKTGPSAAFIVTNHGIWPRTLGSETQNGRSQGPGSAPARGANGGPDKGGKTTLRPVFAITIGNIFVDNEQTMSHKRFTLSSVMNRKVLL